MRPRVAFPRTRVLGRILRNLLPYLKLKVNRKNKDVRKMNRRAKGQRNELRAQKLLESWGYSTFRLYQPRMAKQGCLDIIAVNSESVRFVQVRSNQWGDLREMKALLVPSTTTKEVWLFKDRETEPKQRILA